MYNSQTVIRNKYLERFGYQSVDGELVKEVFKRYKKRLLGILGAGGCCCPKSMKCKKSAVFDVVYNGEKFISSMIAEMAIAGSTKRKRRHAKDA